jgi:hypothetical protein
VGSKLKHKLEPPDSWINAGIGQMTSTNVIKDMVKIELTEEEATRFDHLGIDPKSAQTYRSMPVTIISSPLNHNYHVHFVHEHYGTGARISRNAPCPTTPSRASQLHLLRKNTQRNYPLDWHREPIPLLNLLTQKTYTPAAGECPLPLSSLREDFPLQRINAHVCRHAPNSMNS